MCECKVGPGKFEGEGVLTFLLLARDDGGEYVSYGEGSWGALHLGPVDPPSDTERAELSDAGYCAACIAEFAEDAPKVKAATYGEDSQGFAWSTEWDDASKAQEAYDADEAEMAEAEDDGF